MSELEHAQGSGSWRWGWSLALCAGLAACTMGAPPSFSSGDRWSAPLVGPLEDGLLIVPVSVAGHGPYLFAIDPDATTSAVDDQVIAALEVATPVRQHPIDEAGVQRRHAYGALRDVTIGNLTIDRMLVMTFSAGLYDSEGRQLSGILGRDVIVDRLVFGFDRDQGVVTLATTRAFRAPPGAVAIEYRVVQGQDMVAPDQIGDLIASAQTGQAPKDVDTVPRRVATAQIGDGRFAMHLDLGATHSQLVPERWARARLTPEELSLHLVDEAATGREVTSAGRGDATLGGAAGGQLTFLPYVDRRFLQAGIEGALGLDFFRGYSVYADWDRATLYLKARGDAAATVTARLGRWGAALPSCPHPGCISAAVVERAAGLSLEVTRDPEAAGRGLEVYLGVTPAAGKTAGPLVLELPSAADTLSADLPDDYAGAKLTTLDASPFPRRCPWDGGCALPSTHP